MDSAAIAERLRPFVTLAPEQLLQTAAYLKLLLRWNAKVNLTAVRDPEQIITRHFGESFFAARLLLRACESKSVIDLGSGAGFPGLPLAILARAAEVTLIESNAKKSAFLNEAIGILGISNVSVVRQRAETYTGSADLVVMRAVEKFEASLATAITLVRPGGTLALMIGASQGEVAKKLGQALRWSEAVAIPESQSRVIMTGIKDAEV